MNAGVLTINGGSSSIRFALFAPGEPPRRLFSGKVERIGLADAFLTASGGEGQPPERHPIEAPDHARSGAALIDWLGRRVGLGAVAAVGHRVVHGGNRHGEPQPVTAELLDELHRLCPLDPAHLPGEIALIEAFRRRCPGLAQVACFDTAFHRDLPRVAQLLPIPRRYDAAGVRRFGFHGLSYTYLMEELARVAGREAAQGRVILAHLGAGASLAAVRGGKCMDTSMGFTPTSGTVMGTRSGDLDPGLLLYLMRSEGMTAAELDDLVNRRSGLLGVSETSPDMRDLLSRRPSDRRAAEAIALFAYQARKWIGSFAAALGGVDTLVFAGGIGENAPEVRAEICDDLGFLGLFLDEERNAAGAAVVSTDTSPATVRVMRTDEELVIARAVWRMLGSRPAQPRKPEHPNQPERQQHATEPLDSDTDSASAPQEG